MYSVLGSLFIQGEPDPFILITTAYDDFLQDHFAILSLIDRMDDVNKLRETNDSRSKTLLHWAASVGEINVMYLLMAKGINLNAKDNFGKTALHYAVESKQFNAVQLLLDQDENIKPVPLNELTRLLKCEEDQKQLEKALTRQDKWLLSKMQSTSHKMCYLATRFQQNFEKTRTGGAQVARYFNRNSEVDFYKVIVDAFKEKCRIMDDIKQYIAKQANVNRIYNPSKNKGEQLLHWAAKRNACTIINMLVQKGVNLNIQDEKGKTPLDYAIRNHAIEAIDLLLKRGCAIHPKSFLHIMQTPLLSAQKEVYGLDFPYWRQELLKEMIDFFIKRRVDINTQDTQGNTILHRLAMTSNIELAKFCLRRGANLHMTNYQYKTPLQMAQLAQTPIMEMICYLERQSGKAYSMQVYYPNQHMPLGQALQYRDPNSPAPQTGDIVLPGRVRFR